MPDIASTFGLKHPNVYTPKLNNTTGYNINSKELIGIEVEVENAGHVDGVDRTWMAKGDGSLRNGGVEFVSHPIPASTAPAALAHLMEKLGSSCCFSPRTSVHVHVDYSNAQAEDVFNTLLLYSVYERLFYKFVGRQRIKNIFCVPITETHLLSNYALHGLKPKNWQKYTGLNIKPIEQYGTIEYRHMAGTPDVHKLCVWIDIITRLKEFCIKEGSKAIRAKVAALHDDSDFKGFLQEILGDVADYLKYEHLDDVRFTYTAAKAMLTKPATSINLIQRDMSSNAPIYKVKAK